MRRGVMRAVAVLALPWVGLTGPVAAQDQDPDAGRFEVEVDRLAEGVYVARRVPSWRFWVQANATIIVNESDVVVVDGGGFPAHVENVIAEIRKITDKPVSAVITTHWHQDHNLGVHLYREHYPGVRLISHHAARDTLAERNEEVLPRVTSPEYGTGMEERFRERLREARAEGGHPSIVAFYEDYVRGAEEVARDLRRARSNLADETFGRRLVLHRERRTIELLHLGRANTAGDAVVWLPEERIVVAGDVVVRPTPYGFGSHPREWAETLRRIRALPFEALVPGHGDVQLDDRYVSTLIELMESVSRQTCAAVAAGAGDVEGVRERVNLSEFARRIAREDPLHRHLFHIWFEQPILEAAFREATAEEEACALAVTGSRPTSPVASPTTGFRGNDRRTGAYEGGVEELGGELWRFRTGGPVRSSPTVSGRAVYVGSADGGLYALDRRTGHRLWRFAAGSPVQSSPAVAGERVYVTTRDNAIHAVDRRTGDPAWRVATGETVPFPWGYEGWDYYLSSPAVVDGTVYVGSGDGNVYALDAETGAERWRYETGGRVRSSPAVVDGIVYVGSADGYVYALDAASGSLGWRFETEGASLNSAEFGFDRRSVVSSPAVVDGVVYIGSRDARLYALDAATGEERWRLEEPSAWVMASPAVADGVVYSARSSSGHVRAVDAETGAELWMLDPDMRIQASPTVAGSLVFVGTHGDELLAVERATGAVRWRFHTAEAVLSSAVVAGDAVFFGSDDGHVYALVGARGPSPRRAVYWDDARMPWAALGGREEHRAVADYFEGWGYERLDAASLAAFMDTRIDDGAPSVVVFAMDDLPPDVAPVVADTVLFRRYLDAGGKVVWPGRPPAVFVRDPETGERQGLDRERPARLLGVDHGPLAFDEHGVTVTAAGRRWGLVDGWVGVAGVDPADVDVVLAVDELGRAGAWVERYGGGSGTGFVRVPAGIDPHRLDQLRAVAEFGVFRLPALH